MLYNVMIITNRNCIRNLFSFFILFQTRQNAYLNHIPISFQWLENCFFLFNLDKSSAYDNLDVDTDNSVLVSPAAGVWCHDPPRRGLRGDLYSVHENDDHH